MTTAEEAPVTDTPTQAPAPAPPAMYPHDTWQDTGPFAVPEELREAYAAAAVDVEQTIADAVSGKARRSRWIPAREYQRRAEAGEDLGFANMQRGEGPDRAEFQIHERTDGATALHLRRLGVARKAQQSTPRPLPRRVCAACGESEVAAPGHDRGTITATAGTPAFGLGIAGMLCFRCHAVAGSALAQQTLPDGRTRLRAVLDAAGLNDQGEPGLHALARAEQDRERVREMSQRG